MKFDAATGSIEFSQGTYLRRHMKRRDLVGLDSLWEEWMVSRSGEPTAYKSTISVGQDSRVAKVIVIADFKPDDGPITRWSIALKGAGWCRQAKAEGKYSKQMRVWFAEQTGVRIPVGGDWGDIDVEYDPHNLIAEVLCIYREKFDSEEVWKEYRRKNKF